MKNKQKTNLDFLNVYNLSVHKWMVLVKFDSD